MKFSDVHLLPREKYKLFVMSFYHPVSYEFIGNDCYRLEKVYKFIKSEKQFVDTVVSDIVVMPVYNLTDTYRRYRVYKREQFYDSKLWQLIISIVAAVLASLITNWFMLRIG